MMCTTYFGCEFSSSHGSDVSSGLWHHAVLW